MREDWIECTFGDLLDYEQPTKYIVNSTKYDDSYKTPVLTAGKSFIKGYTNETDGIFDKLPTIIFDDFTTASQFVNFKFKVKSSAMKILIPKSELVNVKFIYYAMQVNKIRSDTHKRYWISVFSKKKFLLPPLTIQRAIVAKIEALFSDLDKGVEELKKVQEQLKVYRQAVLKKAFDNEWETTQIKNVSSSVGGYAFKSKSFIKEKGKYQIVRIGNVRPGALRLKSNPVFVNEVEESIKNKYLLKEGDVVISLTGTRTKRDYGFTAVVKGDNLLLNQRLALIRFDESYVPTFFQYFSWSEYFKKQFFDSETGNTGQGNVGMKSVRDTLIPHLTIEKQKQIVKKLDSQFSNIEMIRRILNENIDKADALKQSILKKAFEGELLSDDEIEKCKQESDYEPASELIKKIKHNGTVTRK